MGMFYVVPFDSKGYLNGYERWEMGNGREIMGGLRKFAE